MLRLPPFRYRAPSTVEEAASILANEEGVTRLVAGGTDLWPNLKRRHQHADTVVGLRRVRELRGMTISGGGETTIGSSTTLTDIVGREDIRSRYPALTRSVASISSPLLRNMGTIGGNLCLDTRCTYYNQNLEWRQAIHYCMKEEGDICWVAPGSPRCWAISASDSAPILCALAARVRLVSKDGERVVPLSELYRDDGIEYLTKRPEEILTHVYLPPPRARTAFWKLRRRGSIDFAVLTVGVAVDLADDGTVIEARIYLGAVNSFPCPCSAATEVLLGQKLDEETVARAGEEARRVGRPLDNTDYLARWRGQMISKYVEGTLREIAGLEPKVKPPRHGMRVI